MIDLTKIDKPFGLLDDETKVALMTHLEAGGGIEIFNGRDWDEVDYIIGTFRTYRAKTQPKVIWVNEYSDRICVHTTEEGARTSGGPTATHIAVRYMEQPE